MLYMNVLLTVQDRADIETVKGLLKEYQYASPRLQVEYVDYMRDVAAALKIKDEYKLASDSKDVIIFESNGGRVIASATELSDYDYTDLVADMLLVACWAII